MSAHFSKLYINSRSHCHSIFQSNPENMNWLMSPWPLHPNRLLPKCAKYKALKIVVEMNFNRGLTTFSPPKTFSSWERLYLTIYMLSLNHRACKRSSCKCISDSVISTKILPTKWVDEWQHQGITVCSSYLILSFLLNCTSCKTFKKLK